MQGLILRGCPSYTTNVSDYLLLRTPYAISIYDTPCSVIRSGLSVMPSLYKPWTAGVSRRSPVQLMAGAYATNSCSEMAHHF
jgi:hypothetical protein